VEFRKEELEEGKRLDNCWWALEKTWLRPPVV